MLVLDARSRTVRLQVKAAAIVNANQRREAILQLLQSDQPRLAHGGDGGSSGSGRGRGGEEDTLRQLKL